MHASVARELPTALVQMKVGPVRKISAFAIAIAVAAPLAGCSFDNDSENCTPLYPSGDASALVDATGAIGSPPTADFPTPLIARNIQSSIVVAGAPSTAPDNDKDDDKDDDDDDAGPIDEGDIVDLQISLYVGETGELLTKSDYDPNNPVRRAVGQDDDVIGALAECATVGSRVAGVLTVADVYGKDRLDASLGLNNDDTLVMLIDIERSFPGRADGAPMLPESGMPSVVLSPDGIPGITIPKESAPDELRIALLQKGEGTTVKKDDQVVLNYTGMLWDSGEIFDSSWDRGVPATFPATSIGESSDGNGVVPGFAKALVGEKVGSQVLVVIPPSEGYPEGQAPAAIPDGSTMVFVIDILGIQ